MRRQFHFAISFNNGTVMQGAASGIRVKRERYTTKMKRIDFTNPNTTMHFEMENVVAFEYWTCPDPLCRA